MLFKKFALIIGICIMIMSCSSTKILKVEKIKVMPGVSTATPAYRYVLEISVQEKTQFRFIKVNDLPEINSFSVINMKTNMQSDNRILYDIGKYRLQFDLPVDNIDEHGTDILKLTFKIGDNIETISKKIDAVKILQLK